MGPEPAGAEIKQRFFEWKLREEPKLFNPIFRKYCILKEAPRTWENEKPGYGYILPQPQMSTVKMPTENIQVLSV